MNLEGITKLKQSGTDLAVFENTLGINKRKTSGRTGRKLDKRSETARTRRQKPQKRLGIPSPENEFILIKLL